jgi:hypothetical protein
MIYSIEQIRSAAIEAALVEWQDEITNVGSESRITAYFDNGGSTWRNWLRAQSGCQNGYVYRQGSGVDYCGMFVAWAYSRAGFFLAPHVCGAEKPRLKQGLVTHVFPSTYRLQSSARWTNGGAPPARPITSVNIQPGDVVVVMTGANKPYGDHIALALAAPSGGNVELVEGNAQGSGPNGPIRGVVKRIRPLSKVARVYRLEAHHFDMVKM